MGLLADIKGTTSTTFTVPGEVVAETIQLTTGAGVGKALLSDSDGDGVWTDIDKSYYPTGIEFGSAIQEYDITGTTWVSAEAGGTLGGVPDDDIADHTLADAIAAISTSRNGTHLTVRELTGAASATNPLTVQFLFSSVSDFDSIEIRSYYHGSASHVMYLQLWNFTTSAWDTYYTFYGESEFVSRSEAIFNPALYISAGVVNVQFIHASNGLATHYLEFDYVALRLGGGGGGSIALASAVLFTPTGGLASTNVQTALAELDTEKASLNCGDATFGLLDTDASHYLRLDAGSDLSADKTLSFITGDSDRSITLSGNPTLNDWFDQAVKAASSPTFANITDSGLTASRLVLSNGSKVLASASYTLATPGTSGCMLVSDGTNWRSTSESMSGTPTLLVSTKKAGGVTDAVDTTGATLLVVAVGFYLSDPSTVTDNKGNTYTKLTTRAGDGTTKTCLYYCDSPVSVGAGHVVTVAGSSIYQSVIFAAFSGTGLYVSETGSGGTGLTSLAPGSRIPSLDGYLLLTSIGFDTSNTLSIDSGYTIAQQQNYTYGSCMGCGLAYYIQPVAGPISPVWSWASSMKAGSGHIVVACNTVEYEPVLSKATFATLSATNLKADHFTEKTASHTISVDSSVTMSLLTASLPLVTDASKIISTISYATFKTNLALAQADISGLTTASSPTFAAIKLTTGAGAGKVLTSDADGDATWGTALTNPMDDAGQIIYGGASGVATKLAAGATTTILVGGGAAAPVWTTATGTGAPVRADTPTITSRLNLYKTDYPKFILSSTDNDADKKKWQIYTAATTGNLYFTSLNDVEDDVPGFILFQRNGYVGIGSKLGTSTGSTFVTTFNLVAPHGNECQIHLWANEYYSSGKTRDANLFLWASEGMITYSGCGIGNNIRAESSTYPYFNRFDTGRGGSYIRLLDGSLTFSTVDSSANHRLRATMGGGLWSLSSWARCLELAQGGVLKWIKGSNYAHGIGQSGDALYFGFSAADDASASMTYGMYLNPTSSTKINLVLSGRIDITGPGTTSSTYTIVAQNSSSSPLFYIRDDGAGFLAAAAWSYSDKKNKENIEDLPSGGVDRIKLLKPINFDFKDGKGPRGNVGFLAEDVQSVIPEAVAVNELGEEGELMLCTSFIVPHIVKAVQEIAERLEKLEKK